MSLALMVIACDADDKYIYSTRLYFLGEISVNDKVQEKLIENGFEPSEFEFIVKSPSLLDGTFDEYNIPLDIVGQEEYERLEKEHEKWIEEQRAWCELRHDPVVALAFVHKLQEKLELLDDMYENSFEYKDDWLEELNALEKFLLKTVEDKGKIHCIWG